MADQGDGIVPARTAAEKYVELTYRHLRFAIVVLLIGLAAGVITEWLHIDCIEGSISAYYYTPVHGFFAGSLVAIGAAMVAINGRTRVEDSLFNIAGLLAPVVALVPTTPQETFLCDGKSLPLSLERDDLIPNSLVVLVVVGFAMVLLTAIFAAAKNSDRLEAAKDQAKSFGNSLRTCVVPLAVFGIAAWIAICLCDVSGYTFMHFGAAIGMFAAIFLALGSLVSKGLHRALHVLLTWEQPKDGYREPKPKFLLAYNVVLFSTPVPIAVALCLSSERTRVFWIEVVGIAAFVAFWIVQTAESWNGLPENPEPPAT